jgi:hypothetical protein
VDLDPFLSGPSNFRNRKLKIYFRTTTTKKQGLVKMRTLQKWHKQTTSRLFYCDKIWTQRSCCKLFTNKWIIYNYLRKFFPKPHTSRTSETENTTTRTITQTQLLEAPEYGLVSPKHIELHLKFRVKLVRWELLCIWLEYIYTYLRKVDILTFMYRSWITTI